MTKVTIDYDVVSSSDYGGFLHDVKEKLADGWTLQGGVSITTMIDGHFTYITYAQAFVRETKIIKKDRNVF